MHSVLRFVFLALLYCCASAGAVAGPVLRLGYSDIESFPYQMGGGLEMADPPGVAIEVIRQAAEDIGVLVTFQRYPNKRVLIELKAGQIDGAFIFSDKEDRRSFARYPMRDGHLDANRRVARLAYHLYRLQGGTANWDGRQFGGLNGPIGANSGYSIVDDLKKLGVRVEEAKNTEQNFSKLMMGRLPAIAAQDDTADPFIARLGVTNIEKLPIPIAAKDYFLIFGHGFAHRNSALVEKLWDRIGEIRDRKTRLALPKYVAP